MADLHYATRTDRSGHKLTTSYANAKSADKYGGANSVRFVGHKYAHISPERIVINEDDSGQLLRSIMINGGQVETDSGRFVIYGKRGNEWAKTPFSASSYGAANAMMKSLIGAYQSLAVIEEDGVEETHDREETTAMEGEI